MMDPYTRSYLHELAKTIEANKKVVDMAQEICTCANCIRSRELKQMSACDNARIAHGIHNRIIGSRPGNYVPELSPNYDLFMSGRPINH